ncbi:MAG TPA: TonB-dependent receptor [Caulobacteraceae bacterium]|nr:TonB-dependent receptor [Caulobacteraceae bacterium]
MAFQSKMTHARLMCGAAAAAVIAFAGAAQAQENQAATTITIAPQSLATALYEFGGQTGRQVLFTPNIADSKVTRGVVGATDQQVALAQLLEGTGLSYRRTGDTYLIVQGAEGGNDPQSGSAAGDGAGTVEALIVTAQKKEEQIQDVPIAISAFTQKSLDAQKIEGGFDLLKAIPNVTFSKNNFTSYNFSIRGIGTKAVSATTDPGVAVSFNNTSLIVNRLFEQDYFDVERVEVLRGPQGTLYGRNATSGVINVISAKPRMGEFEGEIKLETGNYDSRRARGMINIPLGEQFALRVAGALTQRAGYGLNTFDGSDVDDRDLWSSRVTLGWEPTTTFRANLLWEHFEEDDQRVRTSKQLCHRDPGPEFVGEFEVITHRHPVFRYGADLSQGCLPGSLYDKGSAPAGSELAPGFDHGAYGTPNGTSIPSVFGSYIATALTGGFGIRPDALSVDTAACPDIVQGEPDYKFAFILDLCQIDPYGGLGQVRDLRTIESRIPPKYRASADIFELSWDWDVTESLTLTSQTVYNEDETYSTQDFNRFTTLPVFQDTPNTCNSIFALFGQPCVISDQTIWANYAPGGIYTDPQLGPSDTIVGQDIAQGQSTQFSQEFRLASSYEGPVNFSLGANYTKFETDIDYYVFFNLLSYIAQRTSAFNGPTTSIFSLGGECFNNGKRCIYVDPNPLESIDGEGHNYFRSRNPYELESKAVFGELYWNVTPTVKITAGLRYSEDEKIFIPYPTQLLLIDYRDLGWVEPGGPPEDCNNGTVDCQTAGNALGGKGYPADPPIIQKWSEPTGRLVVDWKPELGFTDETMIYASYAHGYKGGGANPPGIAKPAVLFIAPEGSADARPTFEPEYVDAFEIGTKNTLLQGALILNLTAFHYDYEGYQVSKIVNRAAANENFDAKVSGLEMEWFFSPTRALRFNGAFGYLDTEIAEGEQSIDLMDRTQGGRQSFTAPDGRTWNEWVVLKPWITGSSNCVAPVEIVEMLYEEDIVVGGNLCPGGGVLGNTYAPPHPNGVSLTLPDGSHFDPLTDAPNMGAGFFDELGGNELPNAPHWTASVGAQYSFGLPAGWEATLRGDFYWQSQSFARVYNTQYDKLRAWTNTNISLWFEHEDWGVTAEVYVKNAFDEEPITDAFLNGDDAALTTNVFTLDPRLIGVSVTKRF